jgi:outer membrane protein assembly factor BamB
LGRSDAVGPHHLVVFVLDDVAVPHVLGATSNLAFIAVDAKNRVWVAGGPSGEIRAYDGSTGELLGLYDGGAGFINDLVVTKNAVYATNSFHPVLAVVPLGPGGSLPPSGAAGQVPLVAFPALPGFNANGIEAGQDGRLIVAHSAGQALFAVDPATGTAEQIDLGAALPDVDGITRKGSTLYAVQNRLNQIAVIGLDPDLGLLRARHGAGSGRATPRCSCHVDVPVRGSPAIVTCSGSGPAG